MEMRRSIAVDIFFLILFTMCGCSFANLERSVTTTANTLDSALTIYAEREDIPGFEVGVIFHNKVVFSKGFGTRNVETGEPVTGRSLFHMASVSKPFVATALMQLVERNKISLSDKVGNILTYFYLADPRYRDITIGQMLSHLSGMPDVEDYEWNHPRYHQGALKQYIRSLSAEKLISTPGEEYHYSNMAYDILAAVVAEVSGMPFEDYISANILDPAGMIYSTFLRKNVPDSLSVAPHVYDFTNFRMGVSPVYPYNRIHAGSSTLHSNVEDMIRWAFINLYHGKTEGGRILQESSYDSLWKERFPIGEERFIGLSWFISRYHDKTVISHGGGDTGFRSYLLLIPEDTTAVVTMGNSENFQSYGIVRMILDLLYDYPPETPQAPASFSFLSLWGEQGLDSAFRYFKHLRKNPDPTTDFDDGSLITLAWPLFSEGKRDLALKILDYNNQLFPESIWNYQFRAEVLYQMGRKEEAILSLQKALQQDPDNTYTLTLLNQYSSD